MRYTVPAGENNAAFLEEQGDRVAFVFNGMACTLGAIMPDGQTARQMIEAFLGSTDSELGKELASAYLKYGVQKLVTLPLGMARALKLESEGRHVPQAEIVRRALKAYL